ncbi:PLAC8 family-domain-containing protein [Triangularia setosa]|uniref:PLAC8 family-domain-containing protein n=1 Tax=Triangularia setosa TaxID=2587417 RepID=A0AAN7A198_9PEZI|nr:PLAC8 family-domain-containing protein [Podospora setosa]
MAAPAPQATATPSTQATGPISDADVAEWKDKFNKVFAAPSEHFNSKSPATAQPWTHNFWNFVNPLETCLMTWCLPCVVFARTHHRVNKSASLRGYEPINTSCLLFCGSAAVCMQWLPMAIQRADFRAKYNLQGSCAVDVALACCCGCCDIMQMDKEAELRASGEQSQNGIQEQYKAAEVMVVPVEQKQ